MTKIHLDTTYLMPIFGIETSIPLLKTQLQEILDWKSLVFNYSPVSIIEIKLQIIKLGKSGYDREALETQFSQALTSLRFDKRFVKVDFLDSRINDVSHEIMKLGHADYFDTVIASSALLEADIFITEDKDLREIIENLSLQDRTGGLKQLEILMWKDFYKKKGKL